MGLFGARKTVFVDSDILIIGGGMAGGMGERGRQPNWEMWCLATSCWKWANTDVNICLGGEEHAAAWAFKPHVMMLPAQSS